MKKYKNKTRKIILKSKDIDVRTLLKEVQAFDKNDKNIQGKINNQEIIFEILKSSEIKLTFNKERYTIENIKETHTYIVHKVKVLKRLSNNIKKAFSNPSLFKKISIAVVSVSVTVTLFKATFNNEGNFNIFGKNELNQYTQNIDESINWKVTEEANAGVEIGCLTCRKLITIDGQFIYMDLPKML